MDRRWKRRAAALLAALALTIPAHAAQIEVDGQTLSASDAWVEEGTSYVTLRAFSTLTGRTLTWTGEEARLAGAGLTLEAVPERSTSPPMAGPCMSPAGCGRKMA